MKIIVCALLLFGISIPYASHSNTQSPTLRPLGVYAQTTSVPFGNGTDYQNYSVANGDLNNDGFDDLAVAVYKKPSGGPDRIAILYYNTITGAFEEQITQTINLGATQPRSVIIADIDGNGSKDIAVAEYAGQQVDIFFRTVTGSGSGAIITTVTSTLTHIGQQLIKLRVTDFNNDGKLDLVYASGGKFMIAMNNGNLLNQSFTINEYTPLWNLSDTNPDGAINTGDFNNDSFEDLAIGASNGNLYLYKNFNGSIDCSSPSKTINIGGIVTDVAIAKLNSDTKNDFVATSFDGKAHIYLASDNNFNFNEENNIATSDPISVATGDLNADGYIDFIVGSLSTVNTTNIQLSSGYRNGATSLFGISSQAISATISNNAKTIRQIILYDYDKNGTTDIVGVMQDGGLFALSNLMLKTNEPLCTGDDLYVEFMGAPQNATYTWTSPNPSRTITSTTASFTISKVTNNDSGVYLLSVTGGSMNVTSQTISITINPAPNPMQIQGATQICTNIIANYSVTATIGSSYSWTLQNGTPSASTTSSSIQSTTWNIPGINVVMLTETTSMTCQVKHLPQTVTINAPVPVTNITGKSIACYGDQPTYSVTVHTGSVYQWTVLGYKSANGSISSSVASVVTNTSNNILIFPLTVNGTGGVSYTLQVIETVGGCTTTHNPIDIMVLEYATFDIVGQKNLCIGTNETYTINDYSQHIAYNIWGATTTYDWNFPSIANKSNVNNTSYTSNQAIVWNAYGTGTISLTGNTTMSGTTCSVTRPISILILRTPDSSTITIANDICYGPGNIITTTSTLNNTLSYTPVASLKAYCNGTNVGSNTIPNVSILDLSSSPMGMSLVNGQTNTFTVEESWNYTGLPLNGTSSTLTCLIVTNKFFNVYRSYGLNSLIPVQPNICLGIPTFIGLSNSATPPTSCGIAPTVIHNWAIDNNWIMNNTYGFTVTLNEGFHTINANEIWAYNLGTSTLTCAPVSYMGTQINVYNTPSQTVINGTDKICGGSLNNYIGFNYGTVISNNLTATINYTWQLSGSGLGTFSGSTNNRTASINWNNSMGSASLTLTEKFLYTGLNGGATTLSCQSVSTTLISVFLSPLINPINGGNTNVCSGTTVNYTITDTTTSSFTGPAPTITYQWNSSTGLLSTGTQTTQTITWNSQGSQSVSVIELWNYTITGGASTSTIVTCMFTNTLNINVFQIPTASVLTNTDNFCANLTYGFEATASALPASQFGSASPNTLFTWTNGNITVQTNTVTAPNYFFTNWTTGGTNTITLTQAWTYTPTSGTPNSLTCAYTTTKTINIFDNPIAKIIFGRSDVCLNATEVYWLDNFIPPHTFGGTTSVSYNWKVDGISLAGMPSTATNVTQYWTNGGIHTLNIDENWNYSGLLGYPSTLACSFNQINLIVKVYAIPSNKTIFGNDNVCSNTTVTYSINASIPLSSNGKTPTITYNWTLINNGNLISANNNTQTISWYHTGVSSLVVNENWQYNITNSTTMNCTMSNTLTVTVYQNPSTNPISGSNNNCVNSTNNYTITNTTAVASNGKTPTISYIWTLLGLGNQTPATYNNVVNWTNEGITNLNVVEQWQYNGLIGSVNTLACLYTNTLNNIKIFKAPNLKTISGNLNVCSGTNNAYSINPTLTFSSNGITPTITYNWQYTGIGLLQTNSANTTLTCNGEGIFDVGVNEQWQYDGLTAPTSNLTCSFTNSLTNIKVYNSPSNKIITGNTNVCFNTTSAYQIPSNGAITSNGKPANIGYNWLAVSNQTVSSIANNNIVTLTWNSENLTNLSVQETWTYTLAVLDYFSCNNTFSSTIIVYNAPQINTISGSITNCINTNIVYQSNQTNALLSQGIKPTINYNWLLSNPIGSITQLSVTQSVNQILWTTTGTSDLIMTENWIYGPINNNGTPNNITCSFTNTLVNIKIYNAPPNNPIQGSNNLCSGSIINYNPQNNTIPTSNNGIIPTINYHWSLVPNNGNIININIGYNTSINWNIASTPTLNFAETWQYSNVIACTTTNTLSITVNQTPLIGNIVSGSTQACVGTGYDYNVLNFSGASYAWTIPAVGNGNSTNNTITINWATAGSQQLISVTAQNTYSGSLNCISTKTTTVDIYDIPIQHVIQGDVIVCSGQTAKIYSTTDNKPAQNTYRWQITGNTNGFSIQQTQVQNINTVWHTLQQINVFTVTLVDSLNNSAQCKSISSITVTVLPSPEGQGILGPQSVCSKDVGVRYYTNIGTINQHYYNWIFNGIAPYSISQSTISNTPQNLSIQIDWGSLNSPETYTLTLEDYTQYATISCTAAQSIRITLHELPTPSITPTYNSVCSGKWNDIYNSQTISNNVNYLWILNEGGTFNGSHTNTSITINWNPVYTDYTYTLTLREEYKTTLCKATASINVKVNALPAPNIITPYNIVCSGFLGASYNMSPTLNPGDTNNKIVWGVSSGGILSNNIKKNPSITIDWKTNFSKNTETVTLQDTILDIQCISLSIKTVTINPSPLPSIIDNAGQCEGNPLTIQDNSTISSGTITTWKWDFPDGFNSTQNNNSSISHVLSTYGIYTISLTLTSDQNCNFTKGFPINIFANPIPKITPPPPCIMGAPLLFSDLSILTDGSNQLLKAIWNYDDGNIDITPFSVTNTARSTTHSFSKSGDFNVRLKIISEHNCSASTNQMIHILDQKPISDFTLSKSQICGGVSITVYQQSKVTFGSITKVDWYFDAIGAPNAKTTDSQPTYNKSYNSPIYPSFYTPTQKSITIRKVDYIEGACLIENSKTLIIKALPQLVFNPIPNICQEQPAIEITQATVINQLPGSWAYNGKGITLNHFYPQTVDAGTHRINAIFTADNGCIGQVEQNITVYPTPEVLLNSEANTIAKSPIQLGAIATGDNLHYLWFPDTELDNPLIYNPICKPTENRVYLFTATSDKGCVKTATINVNLVKIGVSYNTFSPNGDGINDYWTVEHVDQYPGAVLEIFTRYGERVYDSAGWVEPWDGRNKYNGQELPVGTYFYVLRPKNGLQPITGNISLVK